MTCVSHEDLRRFRRRQLPGDEHQLVEEHLSRCRSCRSRLVDDLRRKTTDFVVANTGVVPERERQHGIRFSDPYMHISLALLWADARLDADFRPLRGDAFAGKRIVAWTGSIAERFVTAFGGVPMSQPANVDEGTFARLLRGEADAILEGQYISLCHATDPANAEYGLRREVLSAPPTDLEFAYPSPIGAFVDNSVAGRALLARINAALADPDTRERIAGTVARAERYCPHRVDG